MADMFAGLSSSDRDNSHMQATASQAPASSGPRRPLSSLQLAPQKSAHLDRLADPLASVGLPQPQHAPMGQGFSAQRGAPAGTSMQGKRPNLFSISKALQRCASSRCNTLLRRLSSWTEMRLSHACLVEIIVLQTHDAL